MKPHTRLALVPASVEPSAADPSIAAPSADAMKARRSHLEPAAELPVDLPPRSLSIWEPAAPSRSTTPTTSEILHVQFPGSLEPELEAMVTRILTRPLAPNESHHTGNANRERELCAVFATLSIEQSSQLGRRLELARPDDPIVAAFSRLVVERRHRLRTFLGDARRRAARRG